MFDHLSQSTIFSKSQAPKLSACHVFTLTFTQATACSLSTAKSFDTPELDYIQQKQVRIGLHMFSAHLRNSQGP